MHDIEMHEVNAEFARCWQAAGRHLLSQTHDGRLGWLKADLIPPFLEHLSFRMGNQLFFIRVEDIEAMVLGPGNPDGFRTIAEGCNGIPCWLPMRRAGSDWKPELPGWGLLHADTLALVNPIAQVTDESIEMTDWEVHDFAVQVVRDYITDQLGHELMSSQSNPGVNPSLWFVGLDGPEWVVVRSARYPGREAALPPNISDIATSCARLSTIGHFAPVTVANEEDPFDRSGKGPPLPLWRGHRMSVRFEGLLPATFQ